MANECTVFEMTAPRVRNAPIRTVPFLAVTQISAAGTVTLNKSTTMVCEGENSLCERRLVIVRVLQIEPILQL